MAAPDDEDSDEDYLLSSDEEKLEDSDLPEAFHATSYSVNTDATEYELNSDGDEIYPLLRIHGQSTWQPFLLTDSRTGKRRYARSRDGKRELYPRNTVTRDEFVALLMPYARRDDGSEIYPKLEDGSEYMGTKAYALDVDGNPTYPVVRKKLKDGSEIFGPQYPKDSFGRETYFLETAHGYVFGTDHRRNQTYALDEHGHEYYPPKLQFALDALREHRWAYTSSGEPVFPKNTDGDETYVPSVDGYRHLIVLRDGRTLPRYARQRNDVDETYPEETTQHGRKQVILNDAYAVSTLTKFAYPKDEFGNEYVSVHLKEKDLVYPIGYPITWDDFVIVAVDHKKEMLYFPDVLPKIPLSSLDRRFYRSWNGYSDFLSTEKSTHRRSDGKGKPYMRIYLDQWEDEEEGPIPAMPLPIPSHPHIVDRYRWDVFRTRQLYPKNPNTDDDFVPARLPYAKNRDDADIYPKRKNGDEFVPAGRTYAKRNEDEEFYPKRANGDEYVPAGMSYAKTEPDVEAYPKRADGSEYMDSGRYAVDAEKNSTYPLVKKTLPSGRVVFESQYPKNHLGREIYLLKTHYEGTAFAPVVFGTDGTRLNQIYAKDERGDEYYPPKEFAYDFEHGEHKWAYAANGEPVFPKSPSGDETYVPSIDTSRGVSHLIVLRGDRPLPRYAMKKGGAGEIYPVKDTDYGRKQVTINDAYAVSDLGTFVYPKDEFQNEYVSVRSGEKDRVYPIGYPVTWDDFVIVAANDAGKPLYFPDVLPAIPLSSLTKRLFRSWNDYSDYLSTEKTTLRRGGGRGKPYKTENVVAETSRWKIAMGVLAALAFAFLIWIFNRERAVVRPPSGRWQLEKSD